MTINGGGTIDGQFSQNANPSSCIVFDASSYIRIDGLLITNCGHFGVFWQGDRAGNAHVKVLNSRFTANRADAINSRGALTDQELAGNYADCSKAIANSSHCFAAHAAYASTFGAVSDLNWHDNNELCPEGNHCNEIGSFYNSSFPSPVASNPVKVSLSHNHCLNTTSGKGSASCDSLAGVSNFDIEGEIYDANNHVFNIGAFEIIASSGSVRGVVSENCNAEQGGGFSVNEVSNFSLSDSIICGGVHTGISAPLYFATSLASLKFHHNTITLPASAQMSKYSCFSFQINHASSTTSQVHVDHNDCTGVSTSDGAALVAVMNGPCTAGITQLWIQNNSAKKTQFVYNEKATGPCAPTNVVYTGNLLGPGTRQFTSGVPSGTEYDNPGFSSNMPYGPTPACTLGAGTGGTPNSPCSSLTGGGITGTPFFSGYVAFTTTGTPVVTGNIFTLTVPAGTFDGAPVCLAQIGYAGAGTYVPIQQDPSVSTASAIVFKANFAPLTTGVLYRINYHCDRN